MRATAHRQCAGCPLMVECLYRAVVEMDVSGFVACTTESDRLYDEILQIGGMHDGVHQQALRLDEDVTFLAFDLLACIETTLTRNCGTFDALAVQATCRRMFASSIFFSQARTQQVLKTSPCPVIGPVEK